MIYELVIEDENIDEVFAISLVKTPAMESNFVYFDKEEIRFAAVNDEKRLVMGPILIPDKKVLRVDGEGKPYHVFFKPETIKRLSEMYLEKKYTDKSTLEHDGSVTGVNLVESWIVEDRMKDKSAVYGLSLPAGTWVGTFKINNDEIWEDYVKEGKVKGFSIEGLFGHNLVAAAKIENDLVEKDIEDLTDEEASIALSMIRELFEFESYTDYGQEISNNAKRGIELNEKNDNKCATQTGKVRAQQLANGEAISLETIKRMYSFLSRAETYYDETDMNACGTISFLLWGGKSALSYSRNKLRELGEIDLKEGVPHYTIDGKLYEGPTHKAGDRLMTGETHTADSKFLYHKEVFAEVGPRGGIKESPKAPKSGTKNPNPKGEGTAKGKASSTRGAKVTAAQEKTLQGKVDEFNEKDSNTKNGRAGLGALKSVFQRGLGAYNTSRSPAVRSAEQWAYARVNAFLYLLKNGRPQNPKYTTDYDLLPKGHPKADTKLEAQPSVTSTYPGEIASGSIATALDEIVGCPESTKNIGLNLYNRQTAIRVAKYGPLNPNEPNEEYWKVKADQFGSSLEEAKKALCGNCVFFYRTPEILKCIADGLGKGVDPYDAIEAGEIGYCEAFDFKCAASRTCSAWVVGGPITQ